MKVKVRGEGCVREWPGVRGARSGCQRFCEWERGGGVRRRMRASHAPSYNAFVHAAMLTLFVYLPRTSPSLPTK